MKLNAVFFDVDGTIAETEDLHRRSFNESFKEFSLDWYWDEAIYKELIQMGGGQERIKHYINRAWPEMLNYKNLTKYISSIHKIKNEIYEDYLTESSIRLRPGVLRLITELREKEVKLGLVSSTSEENVNNLFQKGLKIELNDYFDIVAHGECTINKKPSPEIYEWILEKLKLPPQSCVVIEDSPRGLEAAVGANLRVIITPSVFTENEKFNGAKLVISDLGDYKKPFKYIDGVNCHEKLVNYELLQRLLKD